MTISFNVNCKTFINKRLLVAFSGGKDSLSLLDFLNDQKSKFSYELFACYVNHGIRREAYLDVEFCKKFCEDNNIAFIEKNISESVNSDKSSSLEAIARKYRYIALEDARCDLQCDYILTAHTFDDQIESFFVDLLTGSSIFTMGGVYEANGRILRPMLNVRTIDVENYLKHKNLTPIYDLTNDDDSYVRNSVRHKVLPVISAVGKSYEKTILRLQSQARKLSADYEDILTIVEESKNITLIEKDKFDKLKRTEKEFLLAKTLASKFRVEQAHIENIINLTYSETSKRINLSDNYIFEISYNNLAIFQNDYIEPFEIKKDSTIDNISTPCFNINFINDLARRELTIRSRKAGDRFKGEKVKDLFINKKLLLHKRDRAVIIEEDNVIIWVEHINKRDDIIIDRHK